MSHDSCTVQSETRQAPQWTAYSLIKAVRGLPFWAVQGKIQDSVIPPVRLCHSDCTLMVTKSP